MKHSAQPTYQRNDSENRVAEWLSRDPLPGAEQSQGPNLYEYVDNSPIDLTDPLGLGAGGNNGRGVT
jgi:RHS repeat-associated protein